MALDYNELANFQRDLFEAIVEGGQYYQIGDHQFRRADLKAVNEIMLQFEHARTRQNGGFGLGCISRQS